MKDPMQDTQVTRQELHHRRIDMRAWRRSDGLFEVESRLTDQKSADFLRPRTDKFVPAGQSLHDMGIRLVFDEDLTVTAVSTFTDAAPVDDCWDGGHALQAMVGVKMSSGWGKEVRERLSGARSCTHLRELLMPMATTAYQAIAGLRMNRPEPLDASGRPKKIDSCYAYGEERELVLRFWPEFYRGKAR
jgi:hypothetical protein